MVEVVKKTRFYMLFVTLLTLLVLQIFYFNSKDYNIKSKLNFTKATGMTSFAFNTQIPYQRHPNLHGINQIYTTHPAFRESDMASFINSGRVIGELRVGKRSVNLGDDI